MIVAKNSMITSSLNRNKLATLVDLTTHNLLLLSLLYVYQVLPLTRAMVVCEGRGVYLEFSQLG